LDVILVARAYFRVEGYQEVKQTNQLVAIAPSGEPASERYLAILSPTVCSKQTAASPLRAELP
jgi:hypothetical protein